MKKIVFLIGAGATHGDYMVSAESQRPPLDNRFFINAKKDHKGDCESIAKFFRKNFSYDIFESGHDRLEGIMAMLYSDLYHPQMGVETFEVFRKLIRLYNRRIAETTNVIEPNSKSNLFKLIAANLMKVYRANNISFVTFNQDIHIEKTLNKFSVYKKYNHFGKLLSFPHCYDIDNPILTNPTNPNIKCFDDKMKANVTHPKIYKLHGSLNWYSTHNTSNISKNQIFNPKRKIHISNKSHIDTEFYKLSGKKSVNTFPIIIPPVVHKSSVLHNALKPLWTKSEKLLREATDIIIFGYSCPESDIESSNMIRRGISKNNNLSSLSVIDPNPKVVHRYLDLLEAGFISYYKNVNHYLHNN